MAAKDNTLYYLAGAGALAYYFRSNLAALIAQYFPGTTAAGAATGAPLASTMTVSPDQQAINSWLASQPPVIGVTSPTGKTAPVTLPAGITVTTPGTVGGSSTAPPQAPYINVSNVTAANLDQAKAAALAYQAATQPAAGATVAAGVTSTGTGLVGSTAALTAYLTALYSSAPATIAMQGIERRPALLDQLRPRWIQPQRRRKAA
jgi:hypothetical protein